MFLVNFFDKNEQKLSIGDLVRVTIDGTYYYSEVKYVPEKKAISPMYTFPFAKFEKVDSIPEGFVESENCKDYRFWINNRNHKTITNGENTLKGWKECEREVSLRPWRIEKLSDSVVFNDSYEFIIQDSFGETLREGDPILCLSDRSSTFRFFAEMQYIEDQEIFSPLTTLACSGFQKIDSIPFGVRQADTKVKCWGKNVERFKDKIENDKYMIGVRCLEVMMKSTMKITKVEGL